MKFYRILLANLLLVSGCASSTLEVREFPTSTTIPTTATLLPTIAKSFQPTPPLTPTRWMPAISAINIPHSTTPAVQKPLVSHTGQIAIIVNQVLFVKSSPTFDHFQEIARGVISASWSDTGTELHYFRRTSGEVTEHYRWSDNAPISELLTVAVDTQSNTDMLSRSYQITANRYLVQEHCGSPCEILSMQNEQGQELWRLPWATAGLFAIAPNKEYLINTGRVDVEISDITVDRVDLETGEVEVIWQLPFQSDEYFSLTQSPSFSPDGQFISFNYGAISDQFATLYILDAQGKLRWKLGQSVMPVDWQTNSNGLVVLQQVGEVQSQLVYLPLTVSVSQTLISLTTTVVDGKWSPDSHQFAYSIFDQTNGVSALYLWQTSLPEPLLLHSTASDEAIGNLAWLPNGQELYFTQGELGFTSKNCRLCSSVWQYQLSTNTVILIAATP